MPRFLEQVRKPVSRRFSDALLVLCLPLLLLVSGASCDGSEDDRPPPVSSAGSNHLLPAPPASGGDGDKGGGANVPGDGVNGSTYLLIDDRFVTREAYLDAAAIYVFSGRRDYEAERSDAGEFEVSDAVPAANQWIYAEPVLDERAYPTVVRVDSTGGDVQVELVAETVIDEIMLTMSQSTSINPSAAQLLIHIVDDNENGISGVQAQVIEGATFITYAIGDSWNDLRDNTDSEGLIFAPNLPASALPGQDITVILTGAITEQYRVRVIAGAITVLKIVAP